MKWLIEYWAQIAVLIAAVGYLLKVILDHRFKRKEIGYTVFTKGKLDAITAILETYEAAHVEAFTKLYMYFHREEKVTNYVNDSKELQMLSDKLTKQREHLKFFCKKKEYELFFELTSNFHLVEGAMLLYATNLDREEETHWQWYQAKRQVLIRNEKLLSEIITTLQKVFL